MHSCISRRPQNNVTFVLLGKHLHYQSLGRYYVLYGHDDGAPGMPRMKTVLIVEDDEATRILLARVVAGEGYKDLAVATCDEGLAILAANPVNFVIMDYFVPGTDPGKFVEKVKEKNPSARVILTSRDPQVEKLSQVLRVDAWLSKPIQPDELLQKLSRFNIR